MIRVLPFLLLMYHNGIGQSKIFDSFHQIMGVDFVISIVETDQSRAENQIEFTVKEANKIEQIISSWKNDSQTSLINQNAGIKPVKVNIELLELIERSKRVSRLTDGAFDITVGPLISVWKMDSVHQVVPNSQKIERSKSLVDYQLIEIDKENQTIFLTKKGMSIGFGGIGKGFIAEYLKIKLLQRGIKSGMISAGGDIVVWGEHPKHKLWSIGIADPSNKGKLIGYLKVKNNSVVTSGNYEKFIEIKGKKYTHIIHPKTGFPVEGLKSVTVVCPNAELADALATSCFVMGEKDGLQFVENLKGIEALFIDEKDKIVSTSGLKLSKDE